ncbi:hypothetical protein [Anaerovorax odorimutans]|uniref:hypothetical protein n=1 Tax=Anaerovorax odorimutans TaxID=109327 RepID=UPI00041E70C6|nr:hypothetical protein [Anaerovorax odorimutans]
MDLNNKMLNDLANQLGIQGNDSNSKKAAGMAEKYKGKSDDELIGEILNLKKAMKSDKAQFEKQMMAVKALRGMMNQQQRARLDKIIRLLEND